MRARSFITFHAKGFTILFSSSECKCPLHHTKYHYGFHYLALKATIITQLFGKKFVMIRNCCHGIVNKRTNLEERHTKKEDAQRHLVNKTDKTDKFDFHYLHPKFSLKPYYHNIRV